MELKVGYKQTDIGIVPKDWKLNNFGDVVNYIKGFPFKSKDYREHGIRIIRVSDTTFDSIKINNSIYIDENRINEFRNWKLEEYDLIFSTVGSKPPMYDSMVGKVILIKKENAGNLLNQNAVLIRAKNKTNFIQELLLNHFRTKRYLQYIEGIFRGNANQASITLEDLFKYQIPLPPTKAEQTAIATALSDADNYITHLEKLIAKKRLIKHGAMQELLKPKEGWILKMFPEVCWFQEGPGLRNWQFTTQGMKVINVTNLENGKLNLERTERHISVDEFNKMYKHFEIDDKDIVVASSGNSYAKVAVVRKQDLPLVMNTSVIRFKPLKNLDYNFLLVFLKSPLFKDQIDLLITGGAQPNFGPAHLKKIKINLPANIKDQKVISDILINMDNEIEIIETHLKKVNQIKQGMMQQLLTGKIRLV